MPTKPKVELEFVKVLVAPVVQRRVDGKVVGEEVNASVPLFSPEEVKAFMEEIERQVVELNAASNGNRAARRSRR